MSGAWLPCIRCGSAVLHTLWAVVCLDETAGVSSKPWGHGPSAENVNAAPSFQTQGLEGRFGKAELNSRVYPKPTP